VALSETELQNTLRDLLSSGLSTAAASRQLAAQTGLPKRDLYQMALDLLADQEPEEVAEID
jgi:16S rRNA (cytidine1402-2'-O)-methyltransferase